MTNLERLKALDAEKFWKEIEILETHHGKKYIDYIAYLNSEDNDIMHFVKHEGRCKIIPSEMEIINCCNAAAAQGRELTESEKEIYIATHSKHGLILKRTEMFGTDYAIVLALAEEKLMKVPMQNIITE